MINFNIPPYLGDETKYIEQAVSKFKKICGDGYYTRLCNQWIEQNLCIKKNLLTTSCTHALEMAALLCEVGVGDEVIIPSYTFVSTANAFALRGAKIKFIDIRKDTMNMDEKLIEAAITKRTKVIIPVHYAGVSCEMDDILDIARKYKIKVVEDAAQGILSKYKDKYLGSIGDFGTLSYHETKNITCGEGGSLLVNNSEFEERAEIIREKGTNRSRFHRGQVDKYTWVDIGSSYLLSEIGAAYLMAQFEGAVSITEDRMRSWNYYDGLLKELENCDAIELPFIPRECKHNAHMYYIKCKNLDDRSHLIEHLKNKGVMAVFHYIPLHDSIAGLKYGEFVGADRYTSSESEKLLRLPLYYGMSREDIEYIVENIYKYYKK